MQEIEHRLGALQAMPRLAALSLQHCDIYDAEAQTIGSLTTLTELDLGHARILHDSKLQIFTSLWRLAVLNIQASIYITARCAIFDKPR